MPGGNVALDEDGNFSLSQTMGANAPDGLWYIYYLAIEDKAGNRKAINVDQSGNSLATAILPNDLYLGSTDKTAPEISNLTFTHTVNDDGATVITITGTLTDDGSGMVDGQISLYIKHELTGEQIYMPGGNVVLDEDGNFSLSQTMGANAPDGLWYIYYLAIEDKAGNRKAINVDQSGNSLATAILPNDLYLGSTDKTAPEISNLTFTHTVNDDGATVITITGTLTDDGSGMVDGQISLYIKHELTGEQIYMPGGNVVLDEDGNFSLSQTMGANAPDGLWYIYYLAIEDKAGNRKAINVDQSGNSLATAILPNDLYLGSVGGSPAAGTDVTAPTVRDIEMSSYTENGAVVVKLTGKVGNATYDDFRYISFEFKVADNPTAAVLRFYLYKDEVDWSNGTFDLNGVLDSTHISGTYYLARVYFTDQANNWSSQDLTASSDSPLYGASITVDNPSADVDVTAPTVRDIEMSSYTENGAVVVKLTGKVGNATYDDFRYISFEFKVADNPTAAVLRFYLYKDEVDWSNGTFDLNGVLDSTHISGTYYLARVYFTDQANNWSSQDLTASSDSPLYGASITVDNPSADVDVTAPTVRDIEMSSYTENGAVVVKLTGKVGNATYDDFRYISFEFKVADNPTAAVLRFYLYKDEVDWSNGTFDLDGLP